MQATNLTISQKYEKEIKPQLKAELGLENIFEVPKLRKIVINSRLGSILDDKKAQEVVADNIAKVTGQKPIPTKAKSAIAGFKIRKGQVVGFKTTLRGKKMFDFFQKMVSVVLPRLRDFRGVKKASFDKNGNISISFSEINIFPEVEYTKGEKQTGLQMIINTSAKNKEEAKKLLEKLGMPFEK